MQVRVESIPNWLRWSLTPVASGIAFVVISAALSVVGRFIVFISAPRGGWSENFFDYLLGPAVAGFYAINIVELLAPRAKRTASICIAGIWILLAGAATFFVVLGNEWKSLLYVIALVLGVGYAAMNVGDSST